MAYLGNQPLLSTMRTVAEGTAYAGQTEIPVPGGVISGLNDVIIGGSELGSGDYDDTNGASIELNTPMVAGTMFKVVAWTPNQTVVNAGGQLAGFRNRLINGVPFIRARGDTFSVPGSYVYTHDRWMAMATGANFSLTVGQGPDAQASVCTYITGAASNTQARLQQRVESLNSVDFAVTGCTFSTRVYSSTARAVNLYIYTPTATDNHTSQTLQVSQAFAVQSGWTTLKLTAPASAEFTKGAAVVVEYGAVVAGQNVALTGSQLEPGAVATQFEARSVGLEILLCMRYFEAIGVNGRIVYNQGPTGALMDVPFTAWKRVSPTLIYIGAMPTGENTNTPTAVGIDRNRLDGAQLVWTGSGGPSIGTCGRMLVGGTLQFSAEL